MWELVPNPGHLTPGEVMESPAHPGQASDWLLACGPVPPEEVVCSF